MKKTNDRTLDTVREKERKRESYTLVNGSSALNLTKVVILCLLFKNINMNTKTEIKPI